MRKITVSEQLWQAIAAKGKFGETEEDVLRRMFHLPDAPQRLNRTGAPPGRGNKRFAEKQMKARAERGRLVIEFEAVSGTNGRCPPALTKLRFGR